MTHLEATELIFSIFGSPGWESENVNTYPINHAIDEGITTYIRVDVVTNPIINYGLRGVLLIDIFIPSGDGNKPGLDIAKKLDSYLANKVLDVSGKGNVQLANSSLSTGGIDKDNKGLYRFKYSINFNYYGEN